MSTNRDDRSVLEPVGQIIPDCTGIPFLTLPALARYWAQATRTDASDRLSTLCAYAYSWLTTHQDIRDAVRRSQIPDFLEVSGPNTESVREALADIGQRGAAWHAETHSVLSTVSVFKENFENWCLRNSVPLPRFWFPDASDSGHAGEPDETPEANQMSEEGSRNHPLGDSIDTGDLLDAFRRLERLSPTEITLRLVSGDAIEVQARDLRRRIHYSHLGLWNRRKGCLNSCAAVLVGICKGDLPRRGESNAKLLSRIRGDLFRTALGVTGNPFARDWTPHFKIEDKRNAADERAKQRAVHIPLDSGRIGTEEEYPFDRPSDDDSAKPYLNR